MSTLSTIAASNSAAYANSVFISGSSTSGNSIGGGDWYIAQVPVTETVTGTITIGPSADPLYNPYYPAYPTKTIILDPRVEDLEKRLAAAEELIRKLLPKALELRDLEETDGKRVVEL